MKYINYYDKFWDKIPGQMLMPSVALLTGFLLRYAHHRGICRSYKLLKNRRVILCLKPPTIISFIGAKKVCAGVGT